VLFKTAGMWSREGREWHVSFTKHREHCDSSDAKLEEKKAHRKTFCVVSHRQAFTGYRRADLLEILDFFGHRRSLLGVDKAR
jgi:hypothetical protein